MEFQNMLKRNTTLSACMNRAKNTIEKEQATLYRGKNIGIAILDTGLSPIDDFTLPYNRIVAFRDFVGKKTLPYDDNGHGTQVKCFKSKKISKNSNVL